ncbi:hypothetical protein SS50377_24735 [Spironucleus salmonicida]|uniref:Vacuolar import/degradation Vid27 C-terminal domain-containing protein n=1 Tax=Spironucleus salmonicida TaxID=348837 RepID=V6LLH8_9EUKA|nr:hypothetical protein SS50377_24735 [Spironucleus salmonicida]|eukprot:EST44616.1 hypothetical protein SS50377_15621 [Spironucleus salmonicida]
MSHIQAIIKSVINKQWIVINSEAKLYFNFALIYPVVKVLYSNQELTFTFQQLYEVHKQDGAFALVFKTDTYTALEFTSVNGLHNKTQSDVFTDVLTRADNLLKYTKNPVTIIHHSQVPSDFGFSNQFDCQAFYQDFNADFQKFAGYFCISIIDPNEAILKGMKSGYYMICDSEISGGISQKITSNLLYRLYTAEKQVSMVCEFGGLSFLFHDKAQYNHFSRLLKQAVSSSYQTIYKTNANDTQFYDETFQKSDQEDSEYNNFDDNVETCTQGHEKGHYFDANDRMAVVSLDDVIAIYSNENKNFTKVVLKDLENQVVSVKAKAQNFSILATEINKESVESILSYDLNVDRPKQIINTLKGTDSRQVVDFATNITQNIGNANISSDNGIVGISWNSVYLLDNRMEQSRTGLEFNYVKTPDFSVVHLCKNGSVIIGLDDGSCKIFNKLGNRAINQFQGLGFGITAISTDLAEEYLILTCKNMIIVQFLVDTEGLNMLSKTSQMQHRKSPVIIKISINDAVRAGTLGGLAPAFVSSDNKRLISGSAKTLLIWEFKNIILNKIKNARRVDLGVVGHGGRDIKEGILVGCEGGFKVVR